MPKPSSSREEFNWAARNGQTPEHGLTRIRKIYGFYLRLSAFIGGLDSFPAALRSRLGREVHRMNCRNWLPRRAALFWGSGQSRRNRTRSPRMPWMKSKTNRGMPRRHAIAFHSVSRTCCKRASNSFVSFFSTSDAINPAASIT